MSYLSMARPPVLPTPAIECMFPSVSAGGHKGDAKIQAIGVTHPRHDKYGVHLHHTTQTRTQDKTAPNKLSTICTTPCDDFSELEICYRTLTSSETGDAR